MEVIILAPYLLYNHNILYRLSKSLYCGNELLQRCRGPNIVIFSHHQANFFPVSSFV